MRSSTRARRLAATIVAALAVVLPATLLTPPAQAATADAGLFGSADPAYDGAFRQSLAILGLVAAKAPVPASATAWLTAQQCPDGSFQAYRADVSQPCSVPDPEAFSGPDSNSTALSATALRAVGRTSSAARAIAVLLRAQNADGGWGYTLGGASDVNSTGLSLAALRGAPSSAVTARAISRAMGYLRRVQVPCTAPTATRFGLPFQGGQPANPLASVQALVGIAGTLPAPSVAGTSVVGTRCGDPLIQQVSAYVARQVLAGKGAIPSAYEDGAADWNATAAGVVGLAAAGAAPGAVTTGIRALGRNVNAYVGSGSTASPAAAGTLIQAAVLAGAAPRSFGTGRTNLVAVLLATQRR